MDLATPSLLANRPSCDPILETISTIVRICWCRWHDGHDWHDEGWRCGWRASSMVDTTAPSLLALIPRRLGVNRAVVWVMWPNWWRWCWRWCRWWCRWWRWKWCRWCCGCGLWKCCRWTRATPASCHAAPLLLLCGPETFPIGETIDREANVKLVTPSVTHCEVGLGRVTAFRYSWHCVNVKSLGAARGPPASWVV